MTCALQKLKDVADEFERDLYQQKLAEAEARVAEAEALRERITELEDENAGGCWCTVWCMLCCGWVLVQTVVRASTAGGCRCMLSRAVAVILLQGTHCCDVDGLVNA